ncbi:hypothetical protein BZZ01_13545 [Nostocales cyanobacterium HT-58-2]|nr:hypothetical protein BZZ01_13545 [Nostocales cyanobacterium HT-58-2]
MKCQYDPNNPPVELTEKPKKVEWDEEQLSTIARSKKLLHERLNATRKLGDDLAEELLIRERVKLAEIEETFAATLGDIVSLKPDQYDRIGSFLAKNFGLARKNPLNPSLKYSVPGEVREVLTNSKRLPTQLLDEAGVHLLHKRIGDLRKYVQGLSRAYGIDSNTLAEIVQESIEIGHIPKNNFLYQSDGARFINNRRFRAWESRLIDQGLQQDEIDALRDLSVKVAGAYDDVRLIAKAVNYDLEKLQNIGYVPKVLTRDAEARIRQIDDLKDANLPNTLKADWGKSASTSYTIPADFDTAAKLLNISEQELVEKLFEPKAWTTYLNETLTPAQVDTLVESGVFEKLPMLSREVFETMVKRYDLPYKNLNEMFVTDPQQAISAYISSLKSPLAEHGMLKTIATDGVREGWVLTAGQVESLPVKVRNNFVPLKFDGIDKFYSPQTLPQLDNFYVHRVVADQWRSMLDLSTNPTLLGQAGQILSYLGSAMNKSILLEQGVYYIFRNALSGFVSTISAGANLATVPASLFDMIRVYKGGLEVLDNAKKYAYANGKWYTKRQFMQEFLRLRGSDFAPNTPGLKGGAVKFDALNPLNIGRWLNYTFSYSKAYGAKAGAGYIKNSLDAMLDESFAPVAAMANLIDSTMKWNAFKSLVERPRVANTFNSVAAYATGENLISYQKFTNTQELAKYVDEYFPMFDNIGTTTKFVSKYIRPFGSYAMLNPTMQLRHLMRKPGKFRNYLRLQQLWNHSNDAALIPEAGLSDYQDDEYMIVQKYDKQTGTAFGLFPSNYDPVIDAVDFYSETGKFIERQFFGHYTGNSRDQRKQVRGEDGWQELFKDTLNGSYYGRATSILQGIDPLTGRPRDNTKENTYLGVPMSPLLEALVGSLPLVDRVNQINPFDAFGRKEQRDSQGNVVVEGKPSMFGFQRTDSDQYKATWDRGDWATRAQLLAGMKVRVIDVHKNVVNTYKEMSSQYSELKNRNFKEQQALSLARLQGKISDAEFGYRRAKLAEAIDAEYQIGLDLARLRFYADKNGIRDYEKAYQLMQKNVLILQNQPLVGAEERTLQADYIRRSMQNYGREDDGDSF